MCSQLFTGSLLVDYFTNKPVQFKFPTAMVVGSSGSLLRSRLGKRIDSHDAVIRMNMSPIINYKKHVGSRTTIRLVAHNALGSALIPLLKDCDYFILWGAPQHYEKMQKKIITIRRLYPSLPIYKFTQNSRILNDKEYERITLQHRRKSGAWLSTGWFAIFLALHIAKKVTVCGFGCATRSIKGTPYHYWETRKISEIKHITAHQNNIKGHRFMTEMDVFTKWCTIYSLKFV